MFSTHNETKDRLLEVVGMWDIEEISNSLENKFYVLLGRTFCFAILTNLSKPELFLA